jgi:short-subunit dehydrogenase
MKILLKKDYVIDAYSRNNLKLNNKKINFQKIKNYKKIEFDLKGVECLLIAQGMFKYEPVEKMSLSSTHSLIDSNFTSQIEIVHSFLSQIVKQKNRRMNIVFLGSTNAYESGSGTVIYGACKAGILALVKALNKEYVNSDIRFWLISFGTLNNKMGSQVPNQIKESLLDVHLIAQEILHNVQSDGNLWQPEIVIRRRHIKTKNPTC